MKKKISLKQIEISAKDVRANKYKKYDIFGKHIFYHFKSVLQRKIFRQLK